MRHSDTHLQFRNAEPCGDRLFGDIFPLQFLLLSDGLREDKQTNMSVCFLSDLSAVSDTLFCAKENAFVSIRDYILDVLCHRESDQ